MRQTYALLVDAYRELNAKKLFWITMILSLMFCFAFLLIGFNEQGLKILFYQTSIFGVPDDPRQREMVYGDLFYYIGFKVWLTFGATILALISTAGIFPDLIKEGAIDLLLSKPIGRLRLFITKWATGLMFATLQIVVFTVGCFLAFGLRGGVWMPEMFWGIPLVVIFYSYLFAVCVLAGIISRSTITALIVTVVFWLPLIGLEVTERVAMLPERTTRAYIVENLEENGVEAYTDPEFIDEARVERDLAQARDRLEGIARPHRIIYGIKSLLPKTGETTGLLRTLMYPDVVEENQNQVVAVMAMSQGYRFSPEIAERVKSRLNQTRGPLFVMGTSLLFELLVLALAAWIFCRRDY